MLLGFEDCLHIFLFDKKKNYQKNTVYFGGQSEDNCIKNTLLF